MVDRTAEKTKKANIEKMGEPLGTLFSALWQEVAILNFHWKEYVEPFGTKPERITLLNRAASTFFRMIQGERKRYFSAHSFSRHQPRQSRRRSASCLIMRSIHLPTAR